jgi:hypothetical protein
MTCGRHIGRTCESGGVVGMPVQPYLEQLSLWPLLGRHILAWYDHESIVVYQAFAADIADYAMAHQRFGGRFSFARMSWIEPGFLWMMFRSGWATKVGQQRVLATRNGVLGREPIAKDTQPIGREIPMGSRPRSVRRETEAACATTRRAWRDASALTVD